MRCFIFLGIFLLGSALKAEAPPEINASRLAGTWRYDPERSTELSSWGTLKLTIAVNGPRVTLTRAYTAGRRTFQEVTAIDLSRQVNLVPIEWWPDNRHLGAYVGGDKTKTIRTRLRDDGRLLRLSADFVLATQQGEHAVNILTDYKVSVNGSQLTMIELRSTRNDPIVYVFKRVTDLAADAAADKGRAE